MKTEHKWRYKQTFAQPANRGSVLIISLIFLVILTLLGLSTAKTRTISLKLTGNTQDNNLAMQRAESALREGEELLTGIPPADPLYDASDFNGRNGLDGLYDTPNSVPVTLNAGNAEITSDPLDGNTFYAIQLTEQCVSPGVVGLGSEENFCVTAQSSGNYPNTTVVLQTLLRSVP